MKKFLATAAALGLVAGVAATASALELKVDGTYKVDGYYINQGNGAAEGGDGFLGGVFPFNDFTSVVLKGADNEADSWYWHTFRINPTLIINDRVQIKGDLRLVDDNTTWGSQDDGMLDNGGNIRMRKLWMVYDDPNYGKLEIGRRPAGAWMYDFVNSSEAADRIMYWMPAMDNFKAYAFLQKSTEKDGYDVTNVGNELFVYPLEDTDSDYYEVAGGYTAEGLNAWLGLGWAANQLNDVFPTGSKTDTYRVKGYGDIKINDTFMALGEFDYKWGQTEFNNDFTPDVDISSFAGLIAGVGNFGDLTAVLGYAYISGEDSDPTENTAYDINHGTGDDFEPLYILTGSACNILNGDNGPNLVGTQVRTAGAQAIVALADFKATEDLTLHGGIGWGVADDTDQVALNVRRMLDLPFTPDIDDSYGWEVDLGLAYKIYQNLTYELHFGWWSVGDFAELGLQDIGVGAEDIFLLSHHLTMKF